MATWKEFEAAAPKLAGLGRARMEKFGIVLLGTVRTDGSPRISPIEFRWDGEDLFIGSMPSGKRNDLRRDSRCVLHSIVTRKEGDEGEFKLYGRALKVPGNDWQFRVDIHSAVFITYEHKRQDVTRWAAAFQEKLPSRSPLSLGEVRDSPS